MNEQGSMTRESKLVIHELSRWHNYINNFTDKIMHSTYISMVFIAIIG